LSWFPPPKFWSGAIKLSTNIAIFWDIPPCSPYVNRRFGRTCHLHLQDEESAEQETSARSFLAQLICDPEDGRVETSVQIRTIRRYIPAYGNIITTAVRSSNPTKLSTLVILNTWRLHSILYWDLSYKLWRENSFDSWHAIA
jgi:hypothetical protein